jgi:hypothetical protein
MTTILYHYDPITGEKVNETIAELSPLDNAPMLMSFSTTKMPPVATTNQRAVFRDTSNNVPLNSKDGKWKIVTDLRGQSYWLPDRTGHIIQNIEEEFPKGYSLTEPNQSLDDLKKLKWSEIKLERDNFEFGSFIWNSHEFDSNQLAKQRIILAVLGAQIAIQNGATWSVDWTLKDNTQITLSASDIIQVGLAMGAHTEEAFTHASALKTLIESSKTKQELDNIVW